MGEELDGMDDVRLGRIEQKLDRLSDAVVSLARMEERMITLFKRMDIYDGDAKDSAKRIADLERVSYGRGFFFRAADRVSWLVIGGGIGLLFAFFGRVPQ